MGIVVALGCWAWYQNLDLSFELFLNVIFFHFEIVTCLQIQPEAFR